jgi:arylformamidase
MTKLHDISQPLRAGIPVWPGDTAYSEARTMAIGPDCPVNVSHVTMSTHTGTHADAPFHYDANGVPVGGVDLDRYLGPCRVIDVRGVSPLIEPDHARPHLGGAVRRVLFRTYEKAAVGTWDPDFTAIHPDTIELLHQSGVVLVGLDTPSLDPQESKTLDAHMVVRKHGMAVLESLVLDAVTPGDYELIALPLKLMDLDAAPVRAVLRELS